jgi:hypothetical protein
MDRTSTAQLRGQVGFGRSEVMQGGKHRPRPGRRTRVWGMKVPMHRALAIVALVGCKKSQPIDKAILGEWETWCYTSKDTVECLKKDKDGLHKRFVEGGELVVNRPGDEPSSDKATWRLAKDHLFIEISGGGLKLQEDYFARIDDGRLVLWDRANGRGQVLGRVGAAFAAGDSPISKGGRVSVTKQGTTFTIALPGGYRQTRDDEYKQNWAPASGAGFEVHLSVTKRAQTEVDGKFVTPACNDNDYGGISGSSGMVDGVERETSIGTSICLDGTDLVIMCSTEHTRGYLEPGEKDAALALCKTIKRS